MKLTKAIREAYISSVINDVPQVDYVEEIRKKAVAERRRQLDKKVLAVLDDPKLTNFISRSFCRIDRVGVELVGGPDIDYDGNDGIKLAVALSARKMEEQRNTLASLRDKIRAAAYGATTTKQLAEALPEFAKYLPKDEVSAAKGALAVAGVVDAFKAAGWPAKKAVAA